MSMNFQVIVERRVDQNPIYVHPDKYLLFREKVEFLFSECVPMLCVGTNTARYGDIIRYTMAAKLSSLISEHCLLCNYKDMETTDVYTDFSYWSYLIVQYVMEIWDNRTNPRSTIDTLYWLVGMPS